MAGKKNNATSSWSGYNHQRQVGIFLALKELNELLQKGDSYDKDFVDNFINKYSLDRDDVLYLLK